MYMLSYLLDVNKMLRFTTLFLALITLLACNGSNNFDKPDPITLNGRYTVISSDMQREYFIQLPINYDPDGEPLPLLIAIHGSGDSIEGWMDGGFQGNGLLKLTEDEAIMVIPNGLMNDPVKDPRRNWDATSDRDYDFFMDLLADLDQRVTYDDRRIFVTGHSAGALMTHGLGCRFGDVFRAIAPSAGANTDNPFVCKGSVAVLQINGEFDEIQTLVFSTPSRDYWAQYNGYDKDIFAPTDPQPCVDYSANSLLYPVRYCQHQMLESRGHAWWDQADEAIWDFFTSLEIVGPALDPPVNGGNDKVVMQEPVFDATITMVIEFPEGVGDPIITGLFLYPAGSMLPISGAPLDFVNPSVPIFDVSPGIRTLVIPAGLPKEEDLPATYTLVLAMYIDGSFPIPVSGIDHNLIYELTINDSTTDIVIPGVQPLLVVE